MPLLWEAVVLNKLCSYCGERIATHKYILKSKHKHPITLYLCPKCKKEKIERKVIKRENLERLG